MNSDTKTKAQPQDSEETEAKPTKHALKSDYILETGSVLRTKGRHAIHCLTVIGQIEGHSIAPQTQRPPGTSMSFHSSFPLKKTRKWRGCSSS